MHEVQGLFCNSENPGISAKIADLKTKYYTGPNLAGPIGEKKQEGRWGAAHPWVRPSRCRRLEAGRAGEELGYAAPGRGEAGRRPRWWARDGAHAAGSGSS